MAYWPQWLWLEWLKLLLLYGPAWWCFGLLIPWVIGWRSVGGWQFLMLAPVLIICLKLLDFSWPSQNTKHPANLITLSANLGNMSDAESLARLLEQHNVSIALFQEAKPEKLKALPIKSWQKHCEAGLCIASKLPFEIEMAVSRNIFQGYGNFAQFYRISLADNSFLIANVHFETPRSALESVLKLGPNSAAMRILQQDRALQATIISEWAQAETLPFIIAGDFNMPVLSPIYQQYFSMLGNALSEKSKHVVKYTKFTRWHGIRIDHQLYRGALSPLSAEVLNLPGADHRPVLVRWSN